MAEADLQPPLRLAILQDGDGALQFLASGRPGLALLLHQPLWVIAAPVA